MARLQPHRANISGRNAAFQDERAQYLWGAYTHIILQEYGLAEYTAANVTENKGPKFEYKNEWISVVLAHQCRSLGW